MVDISLKFLNSVRETMQWFSLNIAQIGCSELELSFFSSQTFILEFYVCTYVSLLMRSGDTNIIMLYVFKKMTIYD